MARKGDATVPADNVVSYDGLKVYAAEDGTALYQTRDGMVFGTSEEALSYMETNAVAMLVNEFMADVEADPARYFGNKKGKMEVKERALLALKTRLRNNATKVLSWYLGSENGA